MKRRQSGVSEPTDPTTTSRNSITTSTVSNTTASMVSSTTTSTENNTTEHNATGTEEVVFLLDGDGCIYNQNYIQAYQQEAAMLSFLSTSACQQQLTQLKLASQSNPQLFDFLINTTTTINPEKTTVGSISNRSSIFIDMYNQKVRPYKGLFRATIHEIADSFREKLKQKGASIPCTLDPLTLVQVMPGTTPSSPLDESQMTEVQQLQAQGAFGNFNITNEVLTFDESKQILLYMWGHAKAVQDGAQHKRIFYMIDDKLDILNDLHSVFQTDANEKSTWLPENTTVILIHYDGGEPKEIGKIIGIGAIDYNYAKNLLAQCHLATGNYQLTSPFGSVKVPIGNIAQGFLGNLQAKSKFLLYRDFLDHKNNSYTQNRNEIVAEHIEQTDTLIKPLMIHMLNVGKTDSQIIQIIQQQQTRQPKLLHMRDSFFGNTLLHAAVQQGRHAIAKWLMEQGAEPYAKNFFGETSPALTQDRNMQHILEPDQFSNPSDDLNESGGQGTQDTVEHEDSAEDNADENNVVASVPIPANTASSSAAALPLPSQSSFDLFSVLQNRVNIVQPTISPSTKTQSVIIPNTEVQSVTTATSHNNHPSLSSHSYSQQFNSQ